MEAMNWIAVWNEKVAIDSFSNNIEKDILHGYQHFIEFTFDFLLSYPKDALPTNLCVPMVHVFLWLLDAMVLEIALIIVMNKIVVLIKCSTYLELI